MVDPDFNRFARRIRISAIVAVWLIGSFAIYSLIGKDWCKQTGKSMFSDAFSSELKGCLQHKTWFEF